MRPSTRTWFPALVVLLVYGMWIAAYLGQGRDARDFIRISAAKVRQAHSSAAIRYDPRYRYPAPRHDYDGQYYYFIALDPVHARDYLDEPSTRYGRILYPLSARFLALGRPGLIPYTMILVNWIFLALGTWFVSEWLRRRRISPWYALIYGFYAGLFIGLNRDLTDPMAYGLAAFAVLLWDGGGSRNLTLSALAFGAAALTRETTLVFAAVYGSSLAFVGRRSASKVLTPFRNALMFLSVAAGPFIVYSMVLDLRFGVNRDTAAALPQLPPFGGLINYWPWNGSQVVQFVAVMLPSAICTCVGLAALARKHVSPAVWVLLANVLLFVVFASPASDYHYTSMGRYSEGVALAALYCIPVFDKVTQKRRWWLGASAVGWLLLTPVQLIAYTIRPL